MLAALGLSILEIVAVVIAVTAAVVLLYALSLLVTIPYRRRLAELAIIGQLEAVVRQDLPLATALALAAESERGLTQRRLARIAEFLAHGLSLGQAVRSGYPECPSMVLSLIEAGEKAGQVPAAVEQARRFLLVRRQQQQRLDPSVVPYALLVLTLTLSTTTMIMIVIIPRFKEIFTDFDTALPAATQMLVSASAALVHALPFLLAALILVAGMGSYLALRPRRTPVPYATSYVADWVRWHLPGLRRMQFSTGMSAMLAMMRAALRAGMGLEAATRLAAGLDVNGQLRRRMTHLADLLNRGCDLPSAVVDAGLGGVTATALAGGQRCGDIDAALRYAADYHAGLISRWWVVMRGLAWPLCTLVLATIVGSIVLAIFIPLIALLEAVAFSTGIY